MAPKRHGAGRTDAGPGEGGQHRRLACGAWRGRRVCGLNLPGGAGLPGLSVPLATAAAHGHQAGPVFTGALTVGHHMRARQKSTRMGMGVKQAYPALVAGTGAQAKTTVMATAHHFGEQQAGGVFQGRGALDHAHPAPGSVLAQKVHQQNHHHAREGGSGCIHITHGRKPRVPGLAKRPISA